MNKLRFIGSVILLMMIFPLVKADEGMWLLQLMQQQHSINMMKKSGLKLNATDLYNPNGVSLKDAVGIFGGGCTGEIISPEGLILTNHHCGYGAIQQHSSVEHDYLTNGFWAMNRADELPTPNLRFTFIERIEDITDVVKSKVAAGELTEAQSLSAQNLTKIGQELFAKSDLYGKKGISVQALPFYAGNSFYLFYRKVYTDVRMVAAPPSSVGKFGGETDNWMWPRHTGDFSMFRIYADANGEPANYSPDNKPLKTPKFLSISLKGLSEGDYAMIMGFPGRTSRYLTVSEVKERMTSTNEPRIRIRGARQDVLKAEMAASDKVRIQYASKYAGSSNYWKNSIGMNKAIIDNDVLGTKAKQEDDFEKFAIAKANEDYQKVIGQIDAAVAKTAPLLYQMTCLSEIFNGTEFITSTGSLLRMATASFDAQKTPEEIKKTMTDIYNDIHNKDYDHEVDRKVAVALLPLLTEMVSADQLPTFYADILNGQFGGDYAAMISAIYDKSIFANEANLNAFLTKPTKEALENDIVAKIFTSIRAKIQGLSVQQAPLSQELALLHKTYIRGLGEMKLPTPSYPDANSTLRLTYGNVKPYHPRDGVFYKFYTTAKGILEKEDPNNSEFVVPAKLKELIQAGNFGRYAMKNGELPVCFLTTNDITGGNSGSPVLNDKGQLIGSAFDGNWESLSGDISFDNNLQRCIAVDIRYVLFILDKLGGCQHLINEMQIIE